MKKGTWVVRLPTWLGDTVMAVPTIRALARATSELVLWGPSVNARLLRAVGVHHKVLPYSRRRGPTGLIDLWSGVAALRRLRPSGVVLLPNAYEPALVARLAGIRRRVGFATEWRGNLLTEPLTPPDPLRPQHESRRYADLLGPTPAQSPLPDDWRLAPPTDSRDRLRALISQPDAPILAVVPGCANGPAKRWPARHYARLITAAAEEWGALPVLLGGNQDRSATAAVAAASEVECLDLAGQTDIVDLAALLAGSRAVIANDTGAAHLAGALGVRTLVLFGPTDPLRTKPLGPNVRIASVATFCQPCMSPTCPLDHRCMNGLTPDHAIGMLRPLWKAG